MTRDTEKYLTRMFQSWPTIPDPKIVKREAKAVVSQIKKEKRKFKHSSK